MKQLPDAAHFPYYTSIREQAPAIYLDGANLAALAQSPTVGPKGTAAALTPYCANGKTKEHAQKATYWALVQDHDDDNLSAENLRAIYDPLGCAWLAFTSASHQQDKAGVTANRWKAIIPLAQGIDAEHHAKIANGLALKLDTDKAQARSQQVFYAPNKISETAPYEFIDATDRPRLDALNSSSPLVAECLRAFTEEQEHKQQEALTKASTKPRDVSGITGGIIEKVNAAFDLDGELQAHGYQKIGKAYLSPESTTGNPGVYIMRGNDGTERAYSHHGATDPLSNLNHDGHALDAFDVLCILDYGGDVSRAVAALAPMVDSEGQKQRQREYAAAKEAQQHIALLQDLAAEGAPETASCSLPPYPPELMSLPNQLGVLQKYIVNRMSYPSWATAAIASIATVTAFAQTNLTIKSRDGLGFNEQYLILAPTGFGKEDLRKPIERLSLDADDLLRLQGLSVREDVKIYRAAASSKQGLHQALETNRSVYFISDEFAEWMRLTNSDGHKQAALGYLMEIYTKPLGIVEPGNAVTTKYTPVKNPRLSVLATSTAEAIFETMNREHADSGVYNRWVIFAGETLLPPKRYDGLVFDPPAELVEFVAWLKSQKPQMLTFSSAGYLEYKRLDTELAEPIKRKDGALGGRLGEQAIKLAGLVALSDRRFTIAPSDLQAAFSIRVGLYHRAAALAADKGSMSGLHQTGEALQQVVGLFKANRCLRRSELKARSRKFGKLSVSEQQAVMRQLVEEGHARPDPDRSALLHSNYFTNPVVAKQEQPAS